MTEICAICYAPILGLRAVLGDCKHRFHPWCEYKWRIQGGSCAVCRTRISAPETRNLLSAFEFIGLLEKEHLSLVKKFNALQKQVEKMDALLRMQRKQTKKLRRRKR